jgi:hypothetical protein
MPRQVTCPSCQNRLVVFPDDLERWLTCPRCLTSVGNPNVLLTTEPVSPASELEAPRQRLCPSCDRPVESGWRACPFCEEPLRRARPARRPGSDVDIDVRRDSNGGIIVAAVLGGLLLLGVVMFFAMDGPKLVGSSKDGPTVLAVGVVILGLVVGGCVAIAIGVKKKEATLVSGILGGAAVGTGIVLLFVLLACLSIVAAIDNFFQTCSKGCH